MATANDSAWEHYIKAKKLKLDGKEYVVNADELKEITKREPRLLAKFDDPAHLPRILRENGYVVMAITNGSYRLIKGNIFSQIARCQTQKTLKSEIAFPLATVGRGSGESEYLDNAFNTGILEDFVRAEKLYLTIRGRERSKPFKFKISGNSSSIAVNGVQIEVDAGYEGERDVVLVEAKIGARDSFNIRQLYYPFRHFSILVPNKRVRTLFFEYDLSRATYTFYEFAFADQAILDSARQIDCCTYGLATRAAYRIDELLDVRFETTSPNVPQADDLNKVLELLTLINSGQNTTTDISDYFVFDRRQSNYYGEAAEYLGLISRRSGVFELTQRGSEFLATAPSDQQAFIAKLIINSWVFRELIKRTRRRKYFTANDVDDVIAAARTKDGKEQRYTSTTIPRRRRTIIAWAKWLADQLKCFTIAEDKFYLA
jgi:hypothetical protein